MVLDISTLFHNVWELWQMSKFSIHFLQSHKDFLRLKKAFINNAWATLISATVQANICSSNSSLHCCRYICVALTHNGCIRESWYSVFKSEMSRRVLCNSQNRTYIFLQYGRWSSQCTAICQFEQICTSKDRELIQFPITLLTKTYTNSQSHFVKVFHVGSN